ncbi:MAG: hypothetical protein P8013_04430 [Candidatus Sulfobium sp.]|jgi:peroxiredoxin
MSRAANNMLDTGNFFPEMTFETTGGVTVKLPHDFGVKWNILLFYRGHW